MTKKKYLGIKLTPGMQEACTEKIQHITNRNEIRAFFKKWRDILSSWIGRLSIFF